MLELVQIPPFGQSCCCFDLMLFLKLICFIDLQQQVKHYPTKHPKQQ